VREHLRVEGLFAFETRNPRWKNVSCVSPALQGEGRFAFLETRNVEEDWHTYTDINGRDVRVSGTQSYDHVSQILQWTTYRRWREGAEPRTKITRIAVRYTFPRELEALLHYNGFTIVRQYGDWNLEPLTATSPSIIVVCRATGPRSLPNL
jgi:hypothetical protein